MITPTFSLAYCYAGTVRGEFMRSVVQMLHHPVARSCSRVLDASGAYIHVNRNNLVRAFLEPGDTEWLVFVDVDMIFTGDDVAVLLAVGSDLSVDRRIVAGLYDTYICGMRMPCWFVSLDPPTAASSPVFGTEPMVLTSCGMGFTAIHQSVLSALTSDAASPWFDHEPMPTLTGMLPGAEDWTFCRRAAAKGFQTWGVPTVRLGHVKSSAIYPEVVETAVCVEAA